MGTSVRITAAIFAAYLKCPLKAYLMAQGEKSPETFYADIHQRISVAYKARANATLRIRSPDVLPIDFLQLICDPARDGVTLFVDCETASCACDNPEFLSGSRRGRKSEAGPSYVPIHYSACDKIDQSDDLLVCFGALAIALASGTEIPLSGEVIYGEAHRRRTVKISDGHSKMRQVVEAIVSVSRAAWLPPLVREASNLWHELSVATARALDLARELDPATITANCLLGVSHRVPAPAMVEPILDAPRVVARHLRARSGSRGAACGCGSSAIRRAHRYA